MKRTAIPFAVAAWLFFGGVILQVFLAGMAVFKATDFAAHVGFGWALSSMPLFVLLPLAAVARVDRLTAGLTLVLTASAVLQPELAAERFTDPMIAAFHPVNALFLFGLALLVARRSVVVLRSPALRPEHKAAAELPPATELPPAAELPPATGNFPG